MDIIISNSSPNPIYTQITDQIKAMIISGRLKAGRPLPGMRILAKDLRVSMITTKRAYEELEKEGYIETVAGKGCFVKAPDAAGLQKAGEEKVSSLLSQAVDRARVYGVPGERLHEILDDIYKGE